MILIPSVVTSLDSAIGSNRFLIIKLTYCLSFIIHYIKWINLMVWNVIIMLVESILSHYFVLLYIMLQKLQVMNWVHFRC